MPGYLSRRKPRLTDAATASLIDAAELDGAWDAHVLDETLRHEARFLRLKGEVEAAWRRRVIWLSVGATVVVAGVSMMGLL